MRKHNTVGLVIAGATMSYGAWAAATWLRYGRANGPAPVTSLDRFIPHAEVVDRHEIEVATPSSVAYDAACRLDLTKSPLICLIFGARQLFMGGSDERPSDHPPTLIEETKALGWEILEEVPGREIALGALAKPWMSDPGFRSVDPERFAEYSEPGWAKIAWNFSVEPLSHEKCVVRTETRVVTTDAGSRRRFRKYWSFVSPGVLLIRLIGLRIIKRDAETEYRMEAFARPA